MYQNAKNVLEHSQKCRVVLRVMLRLHVCDPRHSFWTCVRDTAIACCMMMQHDQCEAVQNQSVVWLQPSCAVPTVCFMPLIADVGASPNQEDMRMKCVDMCALHMCRHCMYTTCTDTSPSAQLTGNPLGPLNSCSDL